jgi:hypothetical protein
VLSAAHAKVNKQTLLLKVKLLRIAQKKVKPHKIVKQAEKQKEHDLIDYLIKL